MKLNKTVSNFFYPKLNFSARKCWGKSIERRETMKKLLLILISLILFSACTTFTPDEQERIDFIKDMINNPRKIEEIIKSSKYYDSTYEEKLKNGHLSFFKTNLVESKEKKLDVEIEATQIFDNYELIKEYPGLIEDNPGDFYKQSIAVIFDKKIFRPSIYVLTFKNFKDGKWILTEIAVDIMSY